MFDFFIYFLIYIIIMNSVVEKRLGIAGMMSSTCLGEKCDFS